MIAWSLQYLMLKNLQNSTKNTTYLLSFVEAMDLIYEQDCFSVEHGLLIFSCFHHLLHIIDSTCGCRECHKSCCIVRLGIVRNNVSKGCLQSHNTADK